MEKDKPYTPKAEYILTVTKDGKIKHPHAKKREYITDQTESNEPTKRSDTPTGQTLAEDGRDR